MKNKAAQVNLDYRFRSVDCKLHGENVPGRIPRDSVHGTIPVCVACAEIVDVPVTLEPPRETLSFVVAEFAVVVGRLVERRIVKRQRADDSEPFGDAGARSLLLLTSYARRLEAAYAGSLEAEKTAIRAKKEL